MSARPHEGHASSQRRDFAQRPEGGRPAALVFPVLAEDECHVWAVELEQPAHVQAVLAAHLSEDERQYMQALRLPALRSHYAVAHGALRVLLGRYLGVAPKLCRYATGPRGKPMLAAPCPGPAGGSAHEPGFCC